MTLYRLWQTLQLCLCRSANARGAYIRKNKIFGYAGVNFKFMPRKIPLYPELIRIHNNVFITSDVRFVTHDVTHSVVNNSGCLLGGRGKIPEFVGCIEILDNVFVGAHSILLPNVKIGPNVIIGAGSLIARDCEPDSVYAGVPARRVGSFADFVKRKQEGGYAFTEHNQYITEEEVKRAWAIFESARKTGRSVSD